MWYNKMGKDSVCQVRRLGMVLLGVYHVSVNMFPTYTIYTLLQMKVYTLFPGEYL